MEESTFQKELIKYKLVRKADHYKARLNKKKEVKKIADRSPAPAPVVKKEHVPDAKFWDMVQGAPRSGLTSAEWGKFVAAMRTSHNQIIEILNLEDLESLAELANSGN